jgi:hypothetical protein
MYMCHVQLCAYVSPVGQCHPAFSDSSTMLWTIQSSASSLQHLKEEEQEGIFSNMVVSCHFTPGRKEDENPSQQSTHKN